MISGKQNVRDVPASKLRWARVLWRFKQTTDETVISSGLLMTQRSR
jgi:hypothetical protein